MAAAFIIGKLPWKDVHLLNTISSALWAFSVRPFQLFDAGFQLTFAATLGLILFFLRSGLPFPACPSKSRSSSPFRSPPRWPSCRSSRRRFTG